MLEFFQGSGGAGGGGDGGAALPASGAYPPTPATLAGQGPYQVPNGDVVFQILVGGGAGEAAQVAVAFTATPDDNLPALIAKIEAAAVAAGVDGLAAAQTAGKLTVTHPSLTLTVSGASAFFLFGFYIETVSAPAPSSGTYDTTAARVAFLDPDVARLVPLGAALQALRGQNLPTRVQTIEGLGQVRPIQADNGQTPFRRSPGYFESAEFPGSQINDEPLTTYWPAIQPGDQLVATFRDMYGAEIASKTWTYEAGEGISSFRPDDDGITVPIGTPVAPVQLNLNGGNFDGTHPERWHAQVSFALFDGKKNPGAYLEFTGALAAVFQFPPRLDYYVTLTQFAAHQRTMLFDPNLSTYGSLTGNQPADFDEVIGLLLARTRGTPYVLSPPQQLVVNDASVSNRIAEVTIANPPIEGLPQVTFEDNDSSYGQPYLTVGYFIDGKVSIVPGPGVFDLYTGGIANVKVRIELDTFVETVRVQVFKGPVFGS